MPNYNLLDFMAGTRIDISDNADVTLRLMVTNVLNQRVITDARGNDAYGWTSSSPDIYQMGLFNASRATVFVGPPRMVRLSAVLGLKGLQNRKPKE
jgi:outer membrane receptor protein involved in Fe transport